MCIDACFFNWVFTSVMYEEQETETEETEVVDSYSSVHNSNAMERYNTKHYHSIPTHI